MPNKVAAAIRSKGISIRTVGGSDTEAVKRSLLFHWEKAPEGTVFVMTGTNPKDPEEAFENDLYKFIHQIDGPPKFTVGSTTFIRKTGPLVLSEGVIEWDGFMMFREVILNLVTEEEAIKIIDSWK